MGRVVPVMLSLRTDAGRVEKRNRVMALAPEISVVVLNYNTRELLRGCIASILRCSDGLDLQVIVVDNASPDGSAQMVREDFPWVSLVDNDTNEGYACGVNDGIRMAEAPFVLVLNQDTEIKPGSIKALYDHMREAPRVGIAGPRLVDGSGHYQQSCHYFPLLDPRYALILFMSRLCSPHARFMGLYANPGEKSSGAAEVDWIYGACMLIRREVFDDVGMFDENIFVYGEDMDLCYRARKRGWKVAYLPRSEIVHFGNQSVGQSFSDAQDYRKLSMHASTLDYFLRKHFSAVYSYTVRLFLGMSLIAISVLLSAKRGSDGESAEKRRRADYMRRMGKACLASLFAKPGEKVNADLGGRLKR
jgi:N-acetylglucosaminyl-diphospho-decaprenol L-rhamnosyltransferase